MPHNLFFCQTYLGLQTFRHFICFTTIAEELKYQTSGIRSLQWQKCQTFHLLCNNKWGTQELSTGRKDSTFPSYNQQQLFPHLQLYCKSNRTTRGILNPQHSSRGNHDTEAQQRGIKFFVFQNLFHELHSFYWRTYSVFSLTWTQSGISIIELPCTLNSICKGKQLIWLPRTIV